MTPTTTLDVLVLSNGKDERHRALTRRCLETLRDQRTRHHVRIFVAESHYRPKPLAEYAAVFGDDASDRHCQVFPSPSPFNFNGTVQAGLEFIDRFPPVEPTADNAVLISNNDVTYEPDCLDQLVQALQEVDSVSPWMPGYHDELHQTAAGDAESPTELRLGYEILKHLAGWSYAFNRSILGRDPWLTPAMLFPRELHFWYQDNFYADVLEHCGIRHALVPAARAVHLFESSHDLLTNRSRATVGLKATYQRCRAKLIGASNPSRFAGLWQRLWGRQTAA